MKEILTTIKDAWHENPGEVINSIIFLLGMFGFVYLACWIEANIIY